VQAADVGVVQRGDRFGLAGESCLELGVAGQLRGENLEGYPASQSRVSGAIHLTHSPCANEGQDFVRAKARARL
jgi:hypothetical protein